MGEKIAAEHVQQDLFEWFASIRDKLRRGAKPSYVYSPYKTKHTVEYGENEKGPYAVVNFKMPEGISAQFSSDGIPEYGELHGFRIYTKEPEDVRVRSY